MTIKAMFDKVGVLPGHMDNISPLSLSIIGNNANVLQFSIPESGIASVSIFTLEGKQVEQSIDGYFKKGIHCIKMQKTLSNGIYWANLRTSSGIISSRLIINR